MQDEEKIDRLRAEVDELKALINEAKVVIIITDLYKYGYPDEKNWREQWLKRARKALEVKQ